MPTHDKRKLLTTTQAGILLQRSARTVIRMTEAGELECFGKLDGPAGHYIFELETVQAKAAELLLSLPRTKAGAGQAAVPAGERGAR